MSRDIGDLPIRQPSLAKQVEGILSERILNGTYPPNTQLPTEASLSQEFSVSRATVRSALDSLTTRKLLIRRQGVGTFISQLSRITNPLNHLTDFRDLIESNGFQAGYHQLKVEKIQPDPSVRTALKLKEDQQILKVHKIFTADGEPVIHALNQIPLHFFGSHEPEEILFEPVVAQPFFEFFEDTWGLRIEYAVARLRADIAKNCSIFPVMELDPETPVLIMEETSFTKAEQPVVYSTDYYPGEWMNFSIIRRRISP